MLWFIIGVSDRQQWTPKAQKAFDDIKDFLTEPPILVAPHEEEPLLLYVAATT